MRKIVKGVCKMNKTFQQQLTMYIAFFIMIGVNILANVLPLNGYTTGDVAHLYDVLIVPAGYTFSIWSLIYIGLFIWLICFSLKKHEISQSAFVTFIISCIFNIAWIFAWHYLFNGIAVIIITLHFISVLTLYILQGHKKTTKWAQAPFSMYVGWLMVAAIVNILYYLVSVIHISYATQLSYTYLALCIIIIIGISLLFFWKDWIIQAVFIWSFIGIIVKNAQDNFVLSIVTTIFAVFLIGATVFLLKKQKNHHL